MTRSIIFAFLCLVPLCAIAACTPSRETVSAPEQQTIQTGKTIASTDVVKASVQPLELTAGGSAENIVHLTIQNGYHVNANPPTYSYLKATELEIPASEGVSVSYIVYPDPITKKFAFADQLLAVYEAEASLKAMLKADRTATRGQRHLSAKLRIQACDEQVCYPPGSIDLSIPVTVR